MSILARFKYKVYAIALLTIVAVFVALCIATYAKAFKDVDPVYIRADRSGLQMYPGNRVLFRGVDVGEVAAVKTAERGDGVDITINMKPDMLHKVPANPVVSLDQLTAFGAKTVNLNMPSQRSNSPLEPSAMLTSGRVTVEVNSVFDRLTQVLETAQPAKVDAILGGLAQTLDGRGESIGQTVESVNSYLRKINKDLPRLQRDFAKGADVAHIYADATPDLGAILSNVTTTSRTLVDRQAELEDTFEQVRQLSGTGEDFFAQNGDTIVSLANTLLPTTRLLRKYSPMYTCFVQGLAESDRRLSEAWGNNVTGLHGMTTFVPGVSPYKYPENLPVVGANNGPDCYGLPDLDGHTVPESLMKHMDKGFAKDPYERTMKVGQPPIDAQLFGPRPRPGAAQAQVPSERGGEGR